MKAILPILICSAISAALGYYFGHITVPTDLSGPAPEATSEQAAFTAPAPQPPVEMAENTFEPEAMPTDETPEPEPEMETETETGTGTETGTETASAPAPSESDFAERAAKSTQTLTNTKGQSIEATIVEVLDTEVKIRRSDGLETSIPLNTLSEDDVAFCNYLREQQKEEEVPAPDTSDGFDWDSYFNS